MNADRRPLVLHVVYRFDTGGLENGIVWRSKGQPVDHHYRQRFARYVNGVAMQHGKVSQQMFPEHTISAITNGVHAATWLSGPMQQLLDREVPAWRHDNQYLRSVYGIPPAEMPAIWGTSSMALRAARYRWCAAS